MSYNVTKTNSASSTFVEKFQTSGDLEVYKAASFAKQFMQSADVCQTLKNMSWVGKFDARRRH